MICFLYFSFFHLPVACSSFFFLVFHLFGFDVSFYFVVVFKFPILFLFKNRMVFSYMENCHSEHCLDSQEIASHCQQINALSNIFVLAVELVCSCML